MKSVLVESIMFRLQYDSSHHSDSWFLLNNAWNFIFCFGYFTYDRDIWWDIQYKRNATSTFLSVTYLVYVFRVSIMILDLILTVEREKQTSQHMKELRKSAKSKYVNMSFLILKGLHL